tara:strand:- start:725 stop:850 length:126 start_codon:yes stop_codon:yes gene_type:complete
MAYTMKSKTKPKKKNGNGLTAAQKTLPPFLQKKIKNKKKKG